MRVAGLAIALAFATVGVGVKACQLPQDESTAYNPQIGRLPWRTDLPTTPGTTTFAWQGMKFSTDWRGYMAAFLNEIRATNIRIEQNRLTMNSNAEWWIAPWMDYSINGREALNGLTAERGPDPGDLGPNSPDGLQTWAVGWYNRPGSYAIGQIFADPCDPRVREDFAFPANAATFKFLFTTADPSAVPNAYLKDAPEITALINPIDDPKARKPDASAKKRTPQTMRLLQVDIAVKDPEAKETGWVMGTFVWRRPAVASPADFKGNWMLDNLVPVGLMWGNDPGVMDTTSWNKWSVELKQTVLNEDLRGLAWAEQESTWPQRPWPGFQGRLNGPADNPRSSCLSCHSAAQWRRDHPIVNRIPLNSSLSGPVIRDHVNKFFVNVHGGTRHPGSKTGQQLDYSLQLEAAFDRLCRACIDEKIDIKTPAICKVPRVNPKNLNEPFLERDTCKNTSPFAGFLKFFTTTTTNALPFPRQ